MCPSDTPPDGPYQESTRLFSGVGAPSVLLPEANDLVEVGVIGEQSKCLLHIAEGSHGSSVALQDCNLTLKFVQSFFKLLKGHAIDLPFAGNSRRVKHNS